MKSVLGKLIQTEFGKEQYNEYAQKVDDKQGMDIFCDIYGRLSLRSREDLNEALKNLLTSVQESIWISKNFIKVTLGVIAAVLVLLCSGLSPVFLYGALTVIGAMYGFKIMEYIRNRFCEVDVKIVLIYKVVLFHLLEENGLQKDVPHVY